MRYLALAALVVGCKTNKPPPAPAPTDVVVVAPGAAPLRALRYAVPKGTKTTIELSIDYKVTAGEIASALPTIVTTLDVACDDVAKTGSMNLHAKVVDATAHERADSQVAPASVASLLEPLKGVSMALTLSPDGRVSQPTIDAGAKPLSPAVDQQMKALATSFQQLAMSLPTAPVGVGAKWRTSRKLTQGGMSLTTVTTVDVTAMDATTVSFTLGSEVHGADQTVMQNGIAVELKDLTGTAEGKGTIDLAKGVTTGELHFDLRSQMSSAGSATPMRLQSDITIR
jgi:hypothetical protein